MKYTIAIGDIHGQLDKFTDLLKKVQEKYPSAETKMIFLGDYIDRGPNSNMVVAIIKELVLLGHIALRGNHEQMMIDFSKGGANYFLSNGGIQTIQSYCSGYFPQDISLLPQAFFNDSLWMESLPFCYEDDLRFYVHGGVRPTVSLAEQDNNEMIWIRDLFLNWNKKFEKYIVHGHTPTISRDNKDIIQFNRCNLDTGAGYGFKITAAVFNNVDEQPIDIIQSY